jgi:hypothetical protein
MRRTPSYREFARTGGGIVEAGNIHTTSKFDRANPVSVGRNYWAASPAWFYSWFRPSNGN